MIYCSVDDAYNNNNNQQQQCSWPKVIDAQGDMNVSGPYMATPIKELQYSDDEDEETMDNISVIKRKPMNHKYCINKFLEAMFDSHDVMSIGSSDDTAVYQHVRKCKYCKSEINKKMQYKISQEQQEQPQTKIETFVPTTDSLGYDMKEVVFIIIAGIVLVFILDLLVKIGRKMR